METASIILAKIDSVILNTGQSLFQNTAIAISPFATIAMTLLLIVLGVNMGMNAFQLSMRDSLQIIGRMLLVLLFGLSWANFNAIYLAITDGLQNLAYSFFTVASGEPITANEAMDRFGAQMANTADGVIAAQGSLVRGFIGAVLYVILGFLSAVYVLVVAFAKIAVAVLLGVAPLAILATIFNSTRNLFESWLSSFIGYSMYPVAAAGIVGTIQITASGFFVDNENVAILGDILPFLVTSFVGIIGLAMIPSIASNITGQFNLASVTPQAVRAVSKPGRMAGGYVGRGAKEVTSGAMHGDTSRRADLKRARRNADRGQHIRNKIQQMKLLRK